MGRTLPAVAVAVPSVPFVAAGDDEAQDLEDAADHDVGSCAGCGSGVPDGSSGGGAATTAGRVSASSGGDSGGACTVRRSKPSPRIVVRPTRSPSKPIFVPS